MKPLSEKELAKIIINYRIKCDIYLSDRDDGVMTQNDYENSIQWELDKAIEAILSDRKAWGEHNSKSAEAVNYMISVWDEVIPRWRDTPDHVKQKFIEVERQRNQGEKTDE